MRNGASSREHPASSAPHYGVQSESSDTLPGQEHLSAKTLRRVIVLPKVFGGRVSYGKRGDVDRLGLEGAWGRTDASLSVPATYPPPLATTQFQMEQQKGVQLVNGCRFIHHSGEGNFRCRLRASSRPMEGGLGYRPSNISPSPMETAASSHATPRPASSLASLGSPARNALPCPGTARSPAALSFCPSVYPVAYR